MATMQAWVRTSGDDRNVERAEVPVPTVGEGEVVVKVHAFGVGIHDRYFIPGDARFPYVIGTEAAGIVARVGANVTRVAVGARVMLSSVLQPKGGCWSAYAVVAQEFVAALPDALSFEEGAAIPIAGKTAMECVRALALGAGDTLFIAGASGAIGTLVIQLAAQRGVRVIGSASRANHAYMLSLGAAAAVDYADPDWPQHVRAWCRGGVAAALAIQPGTPADSMAVVRDGGKVVTVSGDPVPAERGIDIKQIEHILAAAPTLETVAGEVAAGHLRLVLEHVHPFGEALDALRKTETRHARGKLVVRGPDADASARVAAPR